MLRHEIECDSVREFDVMAHFPAQRTIIPVQPPMPGSRSSTVRVSGSVKSTGVKKQKSVRPLSRS